MAADEQAVHGVLITYRRPAEVVSMLTRLAGQSRRLDTLVVVDNGADPRIEELVATHDGAAHHVQYIAAPENLGPAGGLALGTTQALRAAGDSGWIMFLDDDDPPRTPDVVREVTAFGEQMLERDPSLAGVGLVGARFDVRTGLGVRLPDEALHGPIEVDCVGGNQFPCYLATAVREVGLPESQLFFGFEELEYGLRLNSAGRRLYVKGELWARERLAHGRTGLVLRPDRTVTWPTWRDYYSTRNLVWILRRNRSHRAAAQVVLRRVLAKPVYNLARRPRTAWAHLALGVRAAFDGYTGRMGRTVEPTV